MPDIRRLIFTERNEEHIARHGVTPDEVREACLSRAMIGSGRHGKIAVYGQALAGRYLMVVLALRPTGAYYVVTAREMNPSERKRYNRWRRR